MHTRNAIIDIHCHTAGIGAGGSGCFVSPALRNSWRYRVYLKAFGVSERELLAQGDGLIMRRISERLSRSRHVDAAVILAMDGVVGEDGQLDRSATEVYIPNDFVAREVRNYPNLLFGASVNPYRSDARARLDQVAGDGAVLLKWLPSIQHIDPADKRLIPFYLRLKELGLPLLTHTGNEESFTWARNELADPERLRLPLSQGVTVIAAHVASNGRNGGERNFTRFLRLCQEFPNLYADISALTQANRIGHLHKVLRHGELHDRLLYGTDMPLLSTGITSPWFHAHLVSPVKFVRVLGYRNPWDRDVELKRSLGAPLSLFGRAVGLLRIPENREVDHVTP
ncbi:MAG: amidohydrolase family protein [Desulfuromonadales bacterium]|nr:amidohydrolase family protein [Desulfuromonadales bacterium]